MTSLIAMMAGGVGLFLLGMWLMTDGLKLASGSALRNILESWTRSSLRGFLAGFFITALVQSSSATTVATVGFVNAGLLTLSQAIWVVIGANVGTTMTGWIVALVGIRIQMAALAMPLIGLGMLLRLLGRSGSRLSGTGQALAGFGVFFLGIDALQDGFSSLTPLLDRLDLTASGWTGIALFLGLGIGLTVITQSSSAAVAVILTASATGSVAPELAAAAAIGTNIGTTSTAAFAAISATPAARRVATAHVLFNLVTAVVALALLTPLLAASHWLSARFTDAADLPATLAVFHTLFNLLGAILIWPLVRRLTLFLRRLHVTPAEQVATPRYIDSTLLAVPDLALRALARELTRMARLTFRLARSTIERPPSAATGPPPEASGLAGLGSAIREFAGQLGAGPSSAPVSRGLQDLIRASQHLGELTQTVSEMQGASLPRTLDAAADITGLRQAAEACLALADGGGPAFLPPERAADLLAEDERQYQEVKSHLLRLAATGRLPVAGMEQALSEAQAIRRMATLAVKAQRRLTPWIEDEDERTA